MQCIYPGRSGREFRRRINSSCEGEKKEGSHPIDDMVLEQSCSMHGSIEYCISGSVKGLEGDCWTKVNTYYIHFTIIDTSLVNKATPFCSTGCIASPAR